jgi:hypothetical protein
MTIEFICLIYVPIFWDSETDEVSEYGIKEEKIYGSLINKITYNGYEYILLSDGLIYFRSSIGVDKEKLRWKHLYKYFNKWMFPNSYDFFRFEKDYNKHIADHKKSNLVLNPIKQERYICKIKYIFYKYNKKDFIDNIIFLLTGSK